MHENYLDLDFRLWEGFIYAFEGQVLRDRRPTVRVRRYAVDQNSRGREHGAVLCMCERKPVILLYMIK